MNMPRKFAFGGNFGKAALVALIAVLVFVLAGCGSSGGSKGGSSGQSGGASGGASASPSASAPADNKTYTIRISYQVPESHFAHKASEKFKQMVEERSGGRLKVELYPGGVLGSENTMDYKLRGVVGYVVDGGCRDSYECNRQQANVFCTKRTFHHVSGRLVHGGVNIPVECAGVTVNPGDIVCADDDGVLVIPRDRAEEVLMFAKAILEDDMKVRAQHYEALGFEPDETLNRLND